MLEETAVTRSVTSFLPADFMDHEPEIFMGCSSGEILVLIGACCLWWLPVGVLVIAVTGNLFSGLSATLPCFLACLGGGVLALRRAKQGRPVGHYRLWLLLFAQRTGLRPEVLVDKSARWGPGRRMG